ncbi:MAG: ATP synthase F0F1 subunit gamma [Parcubacteria group bacterium Gr01-1014_29]|nr:MAG: ATP synthase F0F1 subunit gamma [Parcubacteria group bacterium Gr01-1014_29]
MATLQTIDEEMRLLGYIKSFVETYESLAALYMRRTKQSVVDSRTFYNGLQYIYEEVLQAYQSDIRAFAQKKSFGKRIRQVLLHPRQARSAAVLLSVNTGLYGDIVYKTLSAFVRYISSAPVDSIIVGKRGKLLFNELLPKTPYTFVDFPDNKLDAKHIVSIAELLSKYQEVRIFYGKFESFISQVPADTVLRNGQQQTGARADKSSAGYPAALYLFEPSLQQVAKFFETEIFTALVEQLLYESQLAKFAARMYLLDAAAGRIKNTLNTTALIRQKFIHRKINKEQFEITSYRIALGI